MERLFKSLLIFVFEVFVKSFFNTRIMIPECSSIVLLECTSISFSCVTALLVHSGTMTKILKLNKNDRR